MVSVSVSVSVCACYSLLTISRRQFLVSTFCCQACLLSQQHRATTQASCFHSVLYRPLLPWEIFFPEIVLLLGPHQYSTWQKASNLQGQGRPGGVRSSSPHTENDKFERHESGDKKTINMNNFAGLSRKWVGVKLFMCFPFLGEKGKHLNKVPKKSQEKAGTVPGLSRDP